MADTVKTTVLECVQKTLHRSNAQIELLNALNDQLDVSDVVIELNDITASETMIRVRATANGSSSATRYFRVKVSEVL
jgi:hypothetical protein